MKRLTQLQAVVRVMRPGRWYSAKDVMWAVRRLTGVDYETAGVTARIRDLRKSRKSKARKPRLCSRAVDCVKRGGRWVYRIQR